MNELMKFLYDFVCFFALISIIYFVFINKGKKEYSKLRDNDSVKIFIARYNLDIKKLNYNVILRTHTLINTFILSFSTVLIMNIKDVVWSVIITFAVIIILIYSLQEIAGRYFKRKEEQKYV